MASTSSQDLRDDEFFGETAATTSCIYYPTVTREPFRNRGRITDLIASGKLFDDIGLPPLDHRDRPRHAVRQPRHAGRSARHASRTRGFDEGNHSEPGHFVIEKAFVER